MNVPDDLRVTTEILWQAAIYFAVIDIVLITILHRIIKPKDLLELKWVLMIVMAIFFFLLFGSIVSIVFWDSVYSYVFPLWARWIIPAVYGICFSLVGLFFRWLAFRLHTNPALVGLFFRWLAFRLHTNPVIAFCLLGGVWGFLTHLLAIQRGILEKPPMLQGCSSISALTIATFEFIFYWSICLGFTFFIIHLKNKLLHRLNWDWLCLNILKEDAQRCIKITAKHTHKIKLLLLMRLINMQEQSKSKTNGTRSLTWCRELLIEVIVTNVKGQL